MRLEQALAAVRFVVENASAPVSVYVVGRPRRDRRRGDDGRRGAGHTAERPAEGLHGGAQRRHVHGRARGEGARGRRRARELRPVLHVLPGRRRRVRGRPAGRCGRRQRSAGRGRRRARAAGHRRRRVSRRSTEAALLATLCRVPEATHYEEDHEKAHRRSLARPRRSARSPRFPFSRRRRSSPAPSGPASRSSWRRSRRRPGSTPSS